jgi:hypothetical protein
MPHTKVKQETNMVRDKYVSISFTAIFTNAISAIESRERR